MFPALDYRLRSMVGTCLVKGGICATEDPGFKALHDGIAVGVGVVDKAGGQSQGVLGGVLSFIAAEGGVAVAGGGLEAG